MCKKIITLLLFLQVNFLYAHDHKISICAIFRNEASFLKEWIEYHKIVGVEHFYLYNNRSEDHYQEVLEPYLKAEEVTLIDWPYSYTGLEQWYRIQAKSYMHCANRALGKTEWLAFIDLDEFIVPVEEESLKDLLDSYRSYGGLKVNWVLFGTSNLKTLDPSTPMISQLLMRAPYDLPRNKLIKTIARPECLKINPKLVCSEKFKKKRYKCWTDHAPIFHKKTPPVNEDFKPELRRLTTKHRCKRIRINHYWMRSEEWFLKKQRNSGNYSVNLKHATLESYANYNSEEDRLILKYEERLKEVMK